MKHLIIALACFSAALTAQAKLVTKPVAYEHAGVKLEGYLAYDDSVKTPRPGVLVLPEWWGLTDFPKNRATELAKQGYVAFAADIYGAGVTTSDPKKAGELAGQFYGKPLMAERTQAGLDQLLQSKLVDEKRVAAIGFCFGGTCALSLAYTGAPLAAVVTFHGGLIAPSAEVANRLKPKFLILHGEMDPMVGPEAVTSFKKALDDAKTDYQFISYSGAKHAFTNPEADALGAKNGLTGIGYNEAAAQRSWAHMQLFFQQLFHP